MTPSETRQYLQRELHHTTARLHAMSRIEVDGARSDEVDAVVVSETVELDFVTRDRLRTRVRNLRDALDRITLGTYGLCERCEGAISPARLLAIPEVRLCVGCQDRRERKHRKHAAHVGVFDAFARKVSADESACYYSRLAVE